MAVVRRVGASSSRNVRFARILFRRGAVFDGALFFAFCYHSRHGVFIWWSGDVLWDIRSLLRG